MNIEHMVNEANLFIKMVAQEFGHPGEKKRAAIFIKAVLHTLRERLTMGQSLNFISELPMIFKAVYVDGWKYHEVPIKIKTVEDFCIEVKRHQALYGEKEFDWNMSTYDMVVKFFNILGQKYISQGEFNDILAEMPHQLRVIFPVVTFGNNQSIIR